MPKVSESKRKANDKWDQKNKERKQYINKRSVARNFIKNMEDVDVPEFKKLMEERVSKTISRSKGMKATELLEQIKNNDVAYAIINEEDEVYCNKETSNIMDIYGHDDENGHYYGVYSDIFGGQIDSRYFSDDAILNAIYQLLNLGDPIKRTELPADADFKRTFFFE